MGIVMDGPAFLGATYVVIDFVIHALGCLTWGPGLPSGYRDGFTAG